MAEKLLCLCLLLTSLCPLLTSLHHGGAEEQPCQLDVDSVSTCKSCIREGPGCAWCTDPDLPEDQLRCNTVEHLQGAGCGRGHIYHPQGSVKVTKNHRITPSQQLQPQVVKLSLRPGAVQSFNLTVSTPTGQILSEPGLDIGPLPTGVHITFNTVSTGETQVIQISAEATCPPSYKMNQKEYRTLPQTGTLSWSVHITPRGFSESLKLKLTLQCQCDCMGDRLEDSPLCQGRGALVCGQCECHEPYIGHHCGINLSSSQGHVNCRRGPDAPVCSGNGECIEPGYCACRKFESPEKWYSGMFCECANFHCPRSANRLCGGQGRCECGECICDAEWVGEACDCSLNTTDCLATNQQLCNGRGMCICGQCRCTDPKFQGPTCEDCPTCPGGCEQHRECVLCRAFGTGPQREKCEAECGYFSMRMVDKIPDELEVGFHCRERDQDDCWVYYTYAPTAPSGGEVMVQQTRECPPGLETDWQQFALSTFHTMLKEFCGLVGRLIHY